MRIAVRALGDMRNSTHNSSSPHTCEYFIWIWERNPNAFEADLDIRLTPSVLPLLPSRALVCPSSVSHLSSLISRLSARTLRNDPTLTHGLPRAAFHTTPALSITSATSSPSLPSPSLMEEDMREEEEEEGRRHQPEPEPAEGEEWKSLSRVSNLPLVSGALRAYEQSKASSRVVKVRLFRPRFQCTSLTGCTHSMARR